MGISIDFWDGRYETGDTPWDLGGPSPHFVELLKNRPDFLKPGRVAVPGSGRGHDAALFAREGFEVVGFDYAPAAVEQARQQQGDMQGRVRFEEADIFALGTPGSPWHRQFDYVVEHTCFCAILPKERAAYAQTVRNLLKPGGYLIGVFWQHTGRNEDGPPFVTTLDEVREVFEPDFEILSVDEKKPAIDRSGVERLIILRHSSPNAQGGLQYKL